VRAHHAGAVSPRVIRVADGAELESALGALRTVR
jgi:hypothetical protein